MSIIWLSLWVIRIGKWSDLKSRAVCQVAQKEGGENNMRCLETKQIYCAGAVFVYGWRHCLEWCVVPKCSRYELCDCKWNQAG